MPAYGHPENPYVLNHMITEEKVNVNKVGLRVDPIVSLTVVNSLSQTDTLHYSQAIDEFIMD